jgi:hypothetical protein
MLGSVIVASHDSLAGVGPRDGELSIGDQVLIDAASSDQAKRGNVELTLTAVHRFRDVRSCYGDNHE